MSYLSHFQSNPLKKIMIDLFIIALYFSFMDDPLHDLIRFAELQRERALEKRKTRRREQRLHVYQW